MLQSSLTEPLVLLEIGASSNEVGPKMDAQFSADAEIVFFTRKYDLLAIHLATDSERRLTWDGTMIGDDDHDGHTAGLADYIMQEEFDRLTGYWPAPKVQKRRMTGMVMTEEDRARADADGALPVKVYRVAYLQVDQTEVPTVGKLF